MPAVGLELSYINNDQLTYGDLMLKISDGSTVSKVIAWGQRVFQSSKTKSGNTDITHAGIMLDGETIIESAGDGLEENDLRGKNLGYDYEVYRCRIPKIAKEAASIASMMAGQHNNTKSVKGKGNVPYSLVGAGLSVLRPAKQVGTDDSILSAIERAFVTGKGQSFFCSQFVVCCYQYAAAQHGLSAQSMFALNSRDYSPNKLKDDLFKNQHFYKAGVLRRGIRI
jgi:hypothetical protein